ncbi:MAG: hypothetical protein H0W83_03920 [Planctomycetes bacterium]|nr:hypothetical protein [Planctomycetota bacterium]
MLRPALFVVLLCSTGLYAEDPATPSLADLPKSLRSGAAETVLPIGAVAHIRLSQLAQVMTAVDHLAMSFVPEKAVPPPLQKYLGQQQPLLAWLGDASVGGPLTPTVIADQFGIAADRPLTLTFYPEAIATGWVLTIPIGNEAALGDLLMNVLRPRSCEPVAFGGANGWHLVGTNQALPLECFALRSPETLVLFGSQAIANATLAAGKRLSEDPVIAAIPNAHLACTVSALPVKPLIGMVAKQYSVIPPKQLARWRRDLLRNVPRDSLGSINMQLRWRLGIADIDQLLDYVECLLTATTETAVPALGQMLSGIDGIGLGIELRPDDVRLQVVMKAAGIETLFAQPLPMDEIRAAVAALPGDRFTVSASGRARPPQPSAFAAAWSAAVAQKLAARKLTGGLITAFATYWRDARPDVQLDAEVPWTVTTSYQPKAAPIEAATLSEAVAGMQLSDLSMPELVAFPKQPAGFLEKHLAARAAAANSNDDLLLRLMKAADHDDRWIDPVSRTHAEARPGKPTKLVYENAYLTRSGILSYSQHELVNRTIWYTDVRGGLQLMQRVAGDRTSWLDLPAPTASPLPPAVAHLLDQVEKGCDTLMIARVLPALPRLLDEIARLERTAHREVDAYLAQAAAVVKGQQGNEQLMMAELVKLPIPIQVASLNIDADHRLYCVLPGNLRYPRPLVVPVVQRLMSGSTAKADEVGGLVVTTNAVPGRGTITLLQDLRGLAALVKTTGNALWTDFLGQPDPRAALAKTIGAEHDGEGNPHDEVVVYNTLWPRARR